MKKIPLLLIALALVIFATGASACNSPAGSEGQMRYDSTTKGVFVCTGTDWQQIGVGNLCCGHTNPNGTGWVEFGTAIPGIQGLRMDVDTSGCNFSAPPHYITTLHGSRQHRTTTSISSVYSVGAGSFTVFIQRLVPHQPESLTSAEAIENRWYVSWCAVPGNIFSHSGENKGKLY